MSRTDSPRPIVVGIDGSAPAIQAARWAVDEAVSHDRTLRLVHVIEPGSEAVRLEEEYAEIALRAARSAAEARHGGVRVETAVRRGGVEAVLVEESRHAQMICVGSATGEVLDEPRGHESTTVALARSAGCPLAVVGSTDERAEGEAGCVAVVVDASDTSDPILGEAMREARLRRSSLLVLEVGSATPDGRWDESFDHCMARWQAEFPDVDVHRVAMRTDVVGFLTEIARSVSTTFVDGVEQGRGARLLRRSRPMELHHLRLERHNSPNDSELNSIDLESNPSLDCSILR